jgi:hypothetical protein
MQVFVNLAHAIGDDKGHVTFEQLLSVLEGTEDAVDDTKTTQKRSNAGDCILPSTVRPSAAAALKNNNTIPKCDDPSTTIVSSTTPKAIRWSRFGRDTGAKDATLNASTDTFKAATIESARYGQSQTAML